MGKTTGCYVHFMQGRTVDYSTHIPSPVAMLSAKSETNAGAHECKAMQHIRMLPNKLNGLEVDLIIDPHILMLCYNNGAVIITNIDKDVKSMRHCKRQ